MLRKTVSLLVSMLFILCFAGCASEESVPYNKDATVGNAQSGIVASNSNYQLIWDDTSYCVMLKSLKNGKIWSNIPYEYLNQGGSSASVNSTINITVINTVSMKQDELRGYTEAAENGRIASEKIENGIKVTYYFDNYSISVPVEYLLRDDSVALSVKTEEIAEAGEYKLISFALAPYMCSADNTDTEAYLMVPSGSGALMSVNENADAIRKYSGTVYGEDASRIQPEILVDSEPVYIPVFGAAVSDENALMGIIESGACAAKINAEAGNSRTGWSSIYSEFYVRGYDSYPTTQFIWSYQDLDYFSDDITDMVVTVGYYPLYGDDANYNGMAMRYRNYLEEKGMLYVSESKPSPYALSLVGGALKTVATGGIPHKVTSVVTSFSDAQDIITDASNISGYAPSAQLIGYGNNGLDAGKIAGGFIFSSEFGGEKQRRALENYCSEKGIELYTDFEVVRYSESGKGFSYLLDAAKSASLNVAESYLINTPLRNYDENAAYRFLKKSQIIKAVEKLVKTADKKKISGISLSSLSSVAYSDFSEAKYGVKGETEEIARQSFQKIKESGRKVAASSANSYAAAAADVIYNAPLTNGNYDVFSQWVPFYQMVFSGSKPIYSSYLNLEADSSEAILRAVASGTGLGFAVSATYDIDLSVSKTFSLYGTVYEDNKELISDTVKTYADYYKAIEGAEIINYTLVAEGVSLTEFNNGVKVYVNYTEEKAVTPAGELKPLSSVWLKD